MPAKRARKRYHHGDLRAALLEVADKVLRQSGPEALSLREIARHAGVSEAAPYHHFKDRTALVAAIAQRGFEQLGEAFAREQDPDPGRRLAGMGAAYVAFAIAEPGAFRAMFGAHVVDWNIDDIPELYAAGHPVREAMMSACGAAGRGAKMSKRRLFAQAWGLVHGIAWLHVHKEFPDCVKGDRAAVALAKAAVQTLLAGLQKR
jgi:AcrR family transcriptional regulator